MHYGPKYYYDAQYKKNKSVGGFRPKTYALIKKILVDQYE